MSDDESQRRSEISTSATTVSVGTVDNVDTEGTVNSSSATTNPTRDMSGRRSPVVPPSPPSPSFNESEIRLSRKREREVSLEPVSGKPSKIKDSVPDTPSKKNRIQRSAELDGTVEEDHHHRSSSKSSDDEDHLPPATQADLGIASSPPQEMKIKVRQISQGVEDLTWRNLKKQRKDEDEVIREDKEGEHEAISSDDDAPAPSATQIQVASTSSSASTSRRDSETNQEGPSNLKRKYPDRGTSTEPPAEANGSKSSSGSGSTVEGSSKRPRDDPQKDDNPRETKRPTPPPAEGETETKKEKASTTKPVSSGGFMAYASTSSPFASIKGQNVFSSSNSSSSASKTPLPSSPVLGSQALASSSTSSSAAGIKRTSFEAFANSPSPFASVARPKSPALGSGLGGGSGAFGATSPLGRAKSPSRRGHSHHNTSSVFGSSSSTSADSSDSGNGRGGAPTGAFGAYASGGVQGFSVPANKRARGEGESGARENSTLGRSGSVFGEDKGKGKDKGDGEGGRASSAGTSVSFGEKLRAAGNDEDEEANGEGEGEWDESRRKVTLSEQEVSTGEEHEETIYQVRGKLFTLMEGAWKERGTGLLKINVRAEDGSGARLVMRKEAVYNLLLNVTLFAGMRCTIAQDPRYVRFSVIEGSQVTTHYNIRLANAKIATELMETIHENLPSK